MKSMILPLIRCPCDGRFLLIQSSSANFVHVLESLCITNLVSNDPIVSSGYANGVYGILIKVLLAIVSRVEGRKFLPMKVED